MRPSKRIIVNTIAQYTRSIFNMVLALISTRIILKSLGVDDYGIYSVVAGAVSLLSFITSSLIITTQRFLSVAQGEKNNDKSKIIFNTSLIIHILVGFGVVLVMEALYPFLMNGFLNIPNSRLFSAKMLYHTIVCVVFLTLVTSPFRAVIVSHENIVYISVIEVLDAVLKLLIALSLVLFKSDKLIVYGILLIGIQLFNFLALSFFAYRKFQECIRPRLSLVDKSYVKGIFSFAGWTMYNIGCNYGRNQGIAFALNKAFNTAINAAYGLGFQVSGALSALSQSLANAINPQLMKSEGAGNRARMLRFAEIESKFSFFMMAALAVPAIFEIERLLQIWLGEVPEYAALFCRMVMLGVMCDMLTFGLGPANQAVGNIRNYTLLIFTTKLLTLPVVIALLILKCPLYSVAITYVAFELLSSLFRIPFLHKTAGLSYREFYHKVFQKEVIPISGLLLSCFLCVTLIDIDNRFLFTFPVSIIVFVIFIYCFGLCEDEKEILYGYLLKIRKKLNYGKD